MKSERVFNILRRLNTEDPHIVFRDIYPKGYTVHMSANFLVPVWITPNDHVDRNGCVFQKWASLPWMYKRCLWHELKTIDSLNDMTPSVAELILQLLNASEPIINNPTNTVGCIMKMYKYDLVLQDFSDDGQNIRRLIWIRPDKYCGCSVFQRDTIIPTWKWGQLPAYFHKELIAYRSKK